MTEPKAEKWDLVISSKKAFFSFPLKEVIAYKDLLLLFIKKDIITVYKQTILGPFWFIAQPILSTLAYMFVFGNIAKIPTDGMPAFPFYLSGVMLWTMFSSTLLTTSNTFFMNTNVFGKVYFPRVIIPLSKVASALIKFSIQFVLFLIFVAYYYFKGHIELNWSILLFPFYLVILAALGLGSGLFISAFTTKYRDLKFMLAFGVQLLMYSTTVVYPLSFVTGKKALVVKANPVTHIIEGTRAAFLGGEGLSIPGLLYSFSFAMIILILGLLFFNRTETNFIDTV